MRLISKTAGLAGLCTILLPNVLAHADGTRFSDFSPLLSSAGPTTNEAAPITLGNTAFHQRSIADRTTQLSENVPNTGSWDMLTVNEDGQEKERFLFTVFETGQSGVQRHDLATGQTDTLWFSLSAGTALSFDACYWTPWGTLITAEESWATAANGATSPYGITAHIDGTTAPRLLGEHVAA